MPSDAWPVIHLRGGGADQKRKEARKRKSPSLKNGKMIDKVEEPSLKESDVEERPAKKKRWTQESLSKVADSRPSMKNDPSGNEEAKDGTVDDGTTHQQSQRFIVFIGNLPYTATDAAITAHFAKVRPTSIRHRTDKATGKSKGFAFLEFAAYDRMKTCLKLYHHSTFTDGESPARKINVELTVGGGGAKSRDRKTKLQAKNWKLSEERKRWAVEEAKAQKKILTRNGGGEGKVKGEVEGNAQGHGGGAGEMDMDDIHPSRRSRVTGK